MDQKTFVVSNLTDLTVSMGNITQYLNTYVPGDTVMVPVTVKNTGTTPITGTAANPIFVDVRLSDDGSYDSTDPLINRSQIQLTIASGGSVVFMVKWQIPANTSVGDYSIVAMVDSTEIVGETDETNNTVVGTQQVNVAWEFGNVPGHTGNTVLTFNDKDGTTVMMQLNGPGLGVLTSNADGYGVEINGTSSRSSFTIKTVMSATVGDDGRFTLNHLSVGDDAQGVISSIGSITGQTTDLDGTVDISGSVGSVMLEDVVGASIFVIHSGILPMASLLFDRVHDLTIDSAEAIKRLQATEWTATNSSDNTINATTIQQLLITGDKKRNIAGDFGANIEANGGPVALGTVFISGTIASGAWNAGDVGAITASSIAAGWTGILGNVANITLRGEGMSTISLSANYVHSFSVQGSLENSNITLINGMSKTATLNKMSIAGDLVGSEIRSNGNIGTVQVKSMQSSMLFAGVNTNVTTLPDSANEFENSVPRNSPTITALLIGEKGKGVAGSVFVGSFVAAGSIKTVMFLSPFSMPTGAGGERARYGFATQSGVRRYVGPASTDLYVSGLNSTIS